MIYEKIVDLLGAEIIKRVDKNNIISYIPIDESNSDYQLYLRWLENPDANESGTL